MKYQSDGGPGVRDGLDLLKASDQPEKDQLEFLRAQILFWLLGATDGHAKNFSIQLKFGGGLRMAPLYDVLSIQKALDDRQIRHREFKLAMSLGRRNHCRVNKVAARHFVETARAGHVGEPLGLSSSEKLLHGFPPHCMRPGSNYLQSFHGSLSIRYAKASINEHACFSTEQGLDQPDGNPPRPARLPQQSATRPVAPVSPQGLLSGMYTNSGNIPESFLFREARRSD